MSITCDGDRTRAGEPAAEAFSLARDVEEIIAVGVNCIDPADAYALVRIASESSGKPVVVYPNSGERWDATARSWVGPARFHAEDVEELDQRRRAPRRWLLPRRPIEKSGRFVILSDRTSIVQHCSSAESPMFEICQCLRRLAHRIGHGCGAYAEPLRQPEEGLPSARVFAVTDRSLRSWKSVSS